MKRVLLSSAMLVGLSLSSNADMLTIGLGVETVNINLNHAYVRTFSVADGVDDRQYGEYTDGTPTFNIGYQFDATPFNRIGLNISFAQFSDSVSAATGNYPTTPGFTPFGGFSATANGVFRDSVDRIDSDASTISAHLKFENDIGHGVTFGNFKLVPFVDTIFSYGRFTSENKMYGNGVQVANSEINRNVLSAGVLGGVRASITLNNGITLFGNLNTINAALIRYERDGDVSFDNTGGGLNYASSNRDDQDWNTVIGSSISQDFSIGARFPNGNEFTLERVTVPNVTSQIVFGYGLSL